MATTTTTTTTTTTSRIVSDYCGVDEPNHIDFYNHDWYQKYECGIYYLCTYGLCCPLEESGDLCCAYGSFEDPANVEDKRNYIDHSNVKESKLLS